MKMRVVDTLPKASTQKDRKWEKLADMLKEQRGELILVDDGLDANTARNMRAGLIAEGVDAWVRSEELPEDVRPRALYAGYHVPVEKTPGAKRLES